MGGAGDPVRPRVDCLLVDTIIVRAAAGAALPTNIIILSEGGETGHPSRGEFEGCTTRGGTVGVIPTQYTFAICIV